MERSSSAAPTSGAGRSRVGELAALSPEIVRYAHIGRTFVLVYCLTVLSAGLVAGALALRQPSSAPVWSGPVLAVGSLALGCLLLSAVAERRRDQPLRGPSWDVHSAWWLPAALLVPVRVALLLSLLLLVYTLAVRRESVPRAGLYWGAAVLGLLATRWVIGWEPAELSAGQVAGAAVVLMAVHGVLILGYSRMVLIPRSWVRSFGEPAGLLAEVSCLALGTLLSISVGVNAWFAAAALPVLLLIESSTDVPMLRRSAQLDAKTGLQSTLHWQNQATERLLTARQHHRSTALVLLDVDRFKAVNDSVGHVAGDAVLAAVAQAAAGQLRSGDIIGRFGGDELVALLLSATAEQASVVGNRMRAAVSDLEVVTRAVDGTALRVDGLTVSVGVAGTEQHGFDLADLLLAADGALLQAKRGGRDQVRTS